MGCCCTLCLNTCAFSLSFYKVYMKRENAGSWNSGLEKEQILETYSAQLQKSWNFMENIFGIYIKYWAKKVPEGAPAIHKGGGHALPPWACPLSLWATWQAPDAHLLLYGVFWHGKNQREAFGTKRRRLEAELGQNQSRAPAELFYLGNFPPGGGNWSHRHHQWSSHRVGVNLHQHLTNTISSQTLVHLLYLIFVSKSQIGTCGLLVVLITPCSWC